MKRLLLILLCGMALSFTAQAASFDCGKAATKVEKLTSQTMCACS